MTVEVTNQTTDTFEKVNKKIFDTRDWATPAKTKTQGEKSVDIVYVGLGGANSGTNPDKGIRIMERKLLLMIILQMDLMLMLPLE